MSGNPTSATPKPSIADRRARLRRSLAAEAPGARGLERLARNPGCQRLEALVAAGISPATAADAVYGQPAAEGQSPLAVQTGNRFEKWLEDGGATRLIDLFRREGRLAAGDDRVVVIPDLAGGSGAAAMAQRRLATQRIFGMKLAGNPDAPNIILKPRVHARLLGNDYDIEPDALVGASTDPFYRVVEIKSYPDRGGKTDPADVKSACRQAAVGVVAVRHTLALHLAVTAPSAVVEGRADLVLRRPGSFTPTLHAMSLEGELHSLERVLARGLDTLDRIEDLLRSLGPSAALDDSAVLDRIPANYMPNCREFCGLAHVCRQRELAAGNAVVLGSQAREELAAAGSLTRALELMRGTGAPPTNPQQTQLATRLQEALAHYRTVVPHAR
jgi:hypothetical protein